MHVSDVIFSGRDYNEIIAALDSLAGRFFTYPKLPLGRNLRLDWERAGRRNH